MAKQLPLEGIRVLDLTVVWAGAYCASFLADLGAEVVRVESIKHFAPSTRGSTAHPSKALMDSLPPFVGGMKDRDPGQRPWNRTPLFNAHARNKLGMTVDLRRPEGMDIFKRLAKICDVFVENNVTETLDKLGISYDTVREQNPEIIMLRMPGFGNTGSYKNYRGFGVNIEGLAGHALLRGYADTDPSSNTTVHMGDAAAGAQGAFAVLTALHYRRRTGKGQLIELAQSENMMPFLGHYFMDYFMNGREHKPLGNRHPTAIQGCYPCKGDDRWVTITLYDDSDWRAFAEAIGNPAWTRDKEYATPLGRYAHHDRIDEAIGQWTGQRNHYDVMRILQAAGIAAGPVMDQRDAYNDPHLKAREAFEEAYQEDSGTHLYPGAPYKMSGTPITIRRGPVRLGEDNEYVYKTLLGVSDQEYADLERHGHIGMDYADDVP